MASHLYGRRSRSSTSERLFAAMFLLAFVTPLVGGQVLSVYPYSSSALSRNESSGTGSSNGIINGNFETGDFTGWTLVGTPPYVTIIDYNKSQIFDGYYSAFNHHYYESFYQNLNVTITDYSVFSFAMYAVVAVSDSEWHEILLTVTKSGLGAIQLHYRIQGTQPADTASDKYFLVGIDLDSWCARNRPVKSDLVEKGITEYLGGKITNITCQQGGMCCTVYDSLALTEYDPLSGPSPNAVVNGGFEFQNFTGWTLVGTPPYVTIIDYNRVQVYEGFFSAYNHHYYESFYQDVYAVITNRTEFGAVMLATVSVSDTDSHEIMLTVDEAGLATVLLHYTIQTSQPSDLVGEKYFMIGSSQDQWYVLKRNVWNDLVAKGLSPSSDWRVSRVTCLQHGVCCTVYDSLRLQNVTSLSSNSNAIPNGDFEDSRCLGVGAYSIPNGWSAENHGGAVDSRNTNIDSFTGSRCWEMSTTGNGWKNIWYYFDGAGAPDSLTLAIEIAQGHSDNDIIEIKMNDLTAGLQLMYEFGHGSLQCWTNITTRSVIHEEIDYGLWYNLTKLWKADWQTAYGSPADMSHYWALLLGINTYSISDTMVARYDAVWMENSTHTQYFSPPEANFGFEDSRTHSGGAWSFPYGWTTENHGGQVDSINTGADSYEGSRCWEMSSGPGSGWKNIWYFFNGIGIPDVYSFAIKMVQASSSADVIQVKFNDASANIELIYEFSLGTQQVVLNSTSMKSIHQQIGIGSWYYEKVDWKADWASAFGSPPDMGHYWELLLGVGTPSGTDQMVARFDAVLGSHAESASNAIPNGDFEDPRVYGSGGYAVPYGWTTENHGGYYSGAVDSRNTNVDSFTGSRCWEMSTTSNGWKNIWYYFDGVGAPDVCSFAIKIAQGNSDNDIIQVKIKDLTETDNAGANVELQYEFGHGSLQVHTNNTYQKVLHEQVDYGTWHNETRQWKIDWQNAYGSQPDMTHYWALLIGFETCSVYDVMVARFDSIWMENLTHPQHPCAPESNFGFEDSRVHSGGATSFAYGWTSENHGGQVNSSNTAADSYEGSRCWEMSSGPGSAYKNLWYCFNGPGIPNTCTFALKLVQATNSADIVQVKLKDLTKSQALGSDVELIYEFGIGSYQVWADGLYRKNIHEQISVGIWYNETRHWQADWQSEYGSSPNMSDYWAILLSVSTPVGSDQMIARFDAISLYNGTSQLPPPPPGPVIDPTLALIVTGSGLAAVLIFIGAAAIVSRRRSRADQGASSYPVRVEREDRTPPRGATPRGHPSFCPYCGVSLEGRQANYCPKCGANLQTL